MTRFDDSQCNTVVVRALHCRQIHLETALENLRKTWILASDDDDVEQVA